MAGGDHRADLVWHFDLYHNRTKEKGVSYERLSSGGDRGDDSPVDRGLHSLVSDQETLTIYLAVTGV